MLQEKTTSRRGWLVSGAILLLGLALLSFAFWQKQTIIDYVLASQFQASTDVATIRSDLKLTNRGLMLFNASQPRLQTADEFNSSCQQQKETNNPILGCYVGQRIYIYDIENKKLDGIEETTAAHELLHAAYERMEEHERMEVNAEIKKVLATIMTPDLQKRLEYYQKTEPGEEHNELYAILGSEFPTLGDPLERHYGQYFTSRQTVVAYYKKYNGVFESVTAKLELQLDAINTLTKQTNQQIMDYNTVQKTLNKDILTFNGKSYASAAELRTDRAKLETRRVELQSERAEIISNISKIKELTKERNKVVDEYNALSQSINSSPAPIPSLEN